MLIDIQSRVPHSTTYRGKAVKVFIGLVAVLVALLLSLFLHQDIAPGAPYIRFISRSVIMGIASVVLIGPLAFLLFWLAKARLAKTWLAAILLACFTLGALANVPLTLWLMNFDDEIRRRAALVDERIGFVELRYPGRPPISLARTEGEGYVWRESLDPVPPRVALLFRAAEDERHGVRLSSIDPRSLAGGVWSTFHGRRRGSSTLAEQEAKNLFHITPAGGNGAAFAQKLRKFLIGVRIDDLMRRDEIERLYVGQVSFGSLKGFDISGLKAAATAFYAKTPQTLTVAETVELAERLPNQQFYLPYRRPGEAESDFAARRHEAKKRFSGIVKRAVALGFITESEGRQAEAEFRTTLRPEADVIRDAKRLRLTAVFSELERFALNAKDQRLRADVAADERAQQVLEKAVADGLAEIRMLPVVQRHGTRVLAEAVVFAPDRGILGEVGATGLPSGASSFIKPVDAAAGLEVGVIASIYAPIPGTGITAEQMLARSINEGAERLVSRIGPDRMVPFWDRFGYSVRGEPSVKNAIGAGVEVSPRAAASFVAFGYVTPGRLRNARLIESIVDDRSGEVVYQPEIQELISERTALQIRAALEKTAEYGTTAKVLGPLRKDGPVISKTGTAAFPDRKSHLYKGQGGSWTICEDSVSHVAVIVRVRYEDDRPFEPNGAVSAALIVRNFLSAYRAHPLEVKNATNVSSNAATRRVAHSSLRPTPRRATRRHRH
jgi:membrane peptidoglycan carboxypeptidase